MHSSSYKSFSLLFLSFLIYFYSFILVFLSVFLCMYCNVYLYTYERTTRVYINFFVVLVSLFRTRKDDFPFFSVYIDINVLFLYYYLEIGKISFIFYLFIDKQIINVQKCILLYTIHIKTDDDSLIFYFIIFVCYFFFRFTYDMCVYVYVCVCVCVWARKNL